ncbi:MAG TPA: hypothetical protein VF275_02235, partial [Gammaproteobacteria bacterium]
TPASASFRIWTIWCSENFDLRIENPSRYQYGRSSPFARFKLRGSLRLRASVCLNGVKSKSEEHWASSTLRRKQYFFVAVTQKKESPKIFIKTANHRPSPGIQLPDTRDHEDTTMNTERTQTPRTMNRTATSSTDRSREKKHIAVERWLHRPTRNSSTSGTMRWFG